jgi:hypothetical protein
VCCCRPNCVQVFAVVLFEHKHTDLKASLSAGADPSILFDLMRSVCQVVTADPYNELISVATRLLCGRNRLVKSSINNDVAPVALSSWRWGLSTLTMLNCVLLDRHLFLNVYVPPCCRIFLAVQEIAGLMKPQASSLILQTLFIGY